MNATAQKYVINHLLISWHLTYKLGYILVITATVLHNVWID